MERRGKACLPCRERKTRCSGPQGDRATCSRCQQLSLSCLWLERAKRGQAQNSRKRRLSTPGSSTVTSPFRSDVGASYSRLQSILNRQMEFRDLVRTYFRTVHYYGYLSFIHEPSFWRLVDRGQAPPSLTALIIACTLRFAGDASPGTLAKADEVYDEAFTRLLPQMYQRYGAVDLMTTLLARIFEHARGRFSASWMMVGNCVRMMQYLSLHTFDTSYPENPAVRRSPLLQRESLRRLAWAVFYLDCMVDAGLHGVHTVHENSLHIQLPSDDTTFARGIPGPDHSMGASPSQPNHSISSHLVQSMTMRRRILHFLSSAKYSTSPYSTLHEQLDGLQTELKALVSRLPPDLAYTEGNLFVHAEKRTSFILLHVLRHNCFLVLLAARLELFKAETTKSTNIDQNRPRQVELCMRQRLKHAIPTAHIIQDALRLDVNCDPYVGSLAYTALEVIIFDPIRLQQLNATTEVGTPKQVFIDSVATVMQLLRKIAPMEEGIKNLRVEACRRLLRHGYEDLVNQSDRDALDCLVPAPGTQNETEYDFRSFHWHRYEPRLRDQDLRTASYTSPVRTLATNESMLDPAAASNMPSRVPSPIDESSDAAMVDALADSAGIAGSQSRDPTHASGPSSFGQPPDQQAAILDQAAEDSLLSWLQFDLDVAPARLTFADRSVGQWDVLHYDSWTDGAAVLGAGSSNGAGTSSTDQPELPYWPFQ